MVDIIRGRRMSSYNRNHSTRKVHKDNHFLHKVNTKYAKVDLFKTKDRNEVNRIIFNIGVW